MSSTEFASTMTLGATPDRRTIVGDFGVGHVLSLRARASRNRLGWLERRSGRLREHLVAGRLDMGGRSRAGGTARAPNRAPPRPALIAERPMLRGCNATGCTRGRRQRRAAPSSRICRGMFRRAAGTKGDSFAGQRTAAFSIGIRKGSVCSCSMMSNSDVLLAQRRHHVLAQIVVGPGSAAGAGCGGTPCLRGRTSNSFIAWPRRGGRAAGSNSARRADFALRLVPPGLHRAVEQVPGRAGRRSSRAAYP